MGKLLFSPGGRIDKPDFIKAAVILIILNAILWMSWSLGLGIGSIAGLVSLLFIYMWGCVFAKRFHDSNKAGWLYLVVFIVYIVLFYILAGFLIPTISPQAGELAMKIGEMAQNLDRNDQEAVMELWGMYGPLMKMVALPFALASAIAGAIIAFGTNALLKHDPEENQWGPA